MKSFLFATMAILFAITGFADILTGAGWEAILHFGLAWAFVLLLYKEGNLET